MAFPSKLKQTMMFNDGEAFIGETVSITPPKLVRKFEDYRAGGMSRAVKVDMGGEALEMEATYGGPMRQILRQHGMLNISGVQQRFVGSFQNDDTGAVDVVEIVTRGRHEEIDMGEQKLGEGGEFKVKTAIAYYKLTWNGETEIEINQLGMVFVVGGIDRLAPIRDAMGIF